MPQIPPILAFGILSCAALAGAVYSTAALFIACGQVRKARQRAEAGWAEREAKLLSSVAELGQRVDSLAADLRDFGQQMPQTGFSSGGSARAGLNLTKRAQALRMHRRGNPPDQIAALIEVPIQEVDLLLKVHRIALTNI